MFVPATRAGLAVPVPPEATGTIEKLAVGALPAPPPKTNCPAAKAVLEAQADDELK